jgi:hypothetical protein
MLSRIILQKAKSDLAERRENHMAVFRIIRIYEIPADNRYQATERMLEALELHTEADYHVTDLVREHGEKPAHRQPVDLRPPARWGTIFKRQLTGKW